MKLKFVRLISKIINCLINIKGKLQGSEKDLNTHFLSLTPTDSAENIISYEEALKWALSNREKVKNIAITGTYGSGKSSFIQTYIVRHKAELKEKYLNISLATFTETKDSKKIPQEDVLRLIELSILQQLFYHEEDRHIPDSRFRRIKSFKRRTLYIIPAGILIFTNALLYKINPVLLNEISLFTINNKFLWHFDLGCSIVIIVSLFFILIKLTKVVRGLTITKLNFQSAEIEISEKISKSILNHHIDEILYFFEVTQKQVVFIEDLDRFKTTEVFTKLREINTLINNSKKIKKPVVFIYAIRDEMFEDKERTKFFDFIIPIVPVINSSNSLEKLLSLKKRFQYKLSDSLLEDLSLFIDDMRLLNSIMNEYRIYSKTLSAELDQNKLLGIISYKNLFPSDFYLLSQADGELYSILSKRLVLIELLLIEIDRKISNNESRIREAINHQIKDIKELRSLYVYEIMAQTAKVNNFNQFYLDSNSTITVADLCEDENFQEVVSGNLMYSPNGSYYHRTKVNYRFQDIEKQVDQNNTYIEREELVLRKSEIDLIKGEISKYELEKEKIKSRKLKDLINREDVKITDPSNKNQENFLFRLLKSGYIDENYFLYISIFYAESLSRTDHQFLINVKSERRSEFNHKLNNLDNLIKRIPVFDFEKEYILNYDLAEKLLSEKKYSQRKNRLISLLSDESISSTKFIKGFIETSKQSGKLINLLSSVWVNIWDFISGSSLFTPQDQNRFLTLLLNHADLLNISDILKKEISSINNDCTKLLFINDIDRMKSVISHLKLRIRSISKDLPDEIVEFIVDKHCYSFEPSSIESILRYYNKYEKGLFEKNNWTAISKSELEPLIEHLEENFDEYLEKVFIPLPKNHIEPLEILLEFLNSPEVSEKNKIAIIHKSGTLISEIMIIENKNLWHEVLEQNKIIPTWKNVLDYYLFCEEEISGELISFLNIVENVKALSEVKVPTSEDEKYTTLCRSIVQEYTLDDKTYDLLVKSIPRVYWGISIKSLSKEKINSLMFYKKLAPKLETVTLLREEGHGSFVPKLIELYPSILEDFISDLNFNSFELNQLLLSPKLTKGNKEILIENSSSNALEGNPKNLTLIGKLKISNRDFKLNSTIRDQIMLSDQVDHETRINLFSISFGLSQALVNDFLMNLGSPYNLISNNQKRAKISDTPLNRTLLNSLKWRSYISSYRNTGKELRVYHKRAY